MNTGIELIAAERERQMSKEGWTPEHDAQHKTGEMAMAGAAYAVCAASYSFPDGCRAEEDWARYTEDDYERDPVLEMLWPWEKSWWKPKDALRDLVRAGALIAAEIDKMMAVERDEVKEEEVAPRPSRCPSRKDRIP